MSMSVGDCWVVDGNCFGSTGMEEAAHFKVDRRRQGGIEPAEEVVKASS